MTEAKIWQALVTRLDDWAGVEDMVLSNTVYKPSVDKPFIYVQPVWIDYEDQGIGYECGSEFRGYLNMAVRVPIATWTAAPHMALANRAMALFTYGGKYTYQDAHVTIHERPKLSASIYLDGAHNRIDARVPFRAWG